MPASCSRSDHLAEAVLLAQQQIAAAATANGLREAAAAISAAAGTAGCSHLIPASPAARGAIAAAVLLSDGALHEADDASVASGQSDKLLVVEIAAVSGLLARRRVAALRDAGAEWIGLFVLHDLSTTGHPTPEHDRFGDIDLLVSA